MILLYILLLVISLLVCIILFIFFVIQFIAKFTTHAPFVPVPKETIRQISENFNLDNTSVLYDLGCGDGRILIEASKLNPKTKMIGVEKALLPYFISKFNTRKFSNIKIIRGDIFKTDLSEPSHIFLYLYPQVLEKLLPIFEKQCRKDTKVFSCDFQFKNKNPLKVIDLVNSTSPRGKKLFVYTI